MYVSANFTLVKTCDFYVTFGISRISLQTYFLVTIDVTGLYTHFPREALDRNKDLSVPTELEGTAMGQTHLPADIFMETII